MAITLHYWPGIVLRIMIRIINVSLNNIALFDGPSHSYGGRLLALNIFGKSIIANLTSSEVLIFYGDTSSVKFVQSNNTLIIQNYDALYSMPMNLLEDITTQITTTTIHITMKMSTLMDTVMTLIILLGNQTYK